MRAGPGLVSRSPRGLCLLLSAHAFAAASSSPSRAARNSLRSMTAPLDQQGRRRVAAPGVSSVVTRRPDGTQPRHLGALGHVSALTYSWSNPGGPDQLSCTLQVPPDQRTDATNPGRICDVIRGGRVIWTGKLMEPAPPSAGC